MPLQIRRGTAGDRNALTTPLAIGELLYVTDQGRLYIGDGTALGSPDIMGNPGEGGKGLIITGFTTEDAHDAIDSLLSAGTHTNITFTYDDVGNSLSATVNLSTYTGNISVEGQLSANSIKGSIFADDSTLLVDAGSATIPYSVLSGAPTNVSQFTNDAGYITSAEIADGTLTIDVNNTGDLVGSVFGDDSTLLVDSSTSTIPASVLAGTATINVTGDLTGDSYGVHYGGIVGTYIQTADSSALNMLSPVAFATRATFDSEIEVKDGIISTSIDPLTNGIVLDSTNNTDQSSNIAIRRARGAVGSLASVQTDDRLGSYLFSAHDGTSYVAAASVQAQVAGTPGSGFVPSKLRLLVTNSLGVQVEGLTVESTGTVKAYANATAYSPLILQTANNTTFGNLLPLQRSRGTVQAPVVSQNGDTLFGVAFQGWDGDEFRTAANIRGAVDDTVANNIVPGRIEFITADSAGAYAVRMQLNKDGVLEVDTIQGRTNSWVTFTEMPVLPSYANETAADTAIGGAGNRVNGMMFLDSGSSQMKMCIGGSWVVVGP